MQWLLDYFNLSPPAGGIQAAPEPIPLEWQLALYAVLVLGILANGYLAAARTKQRYRFQWRRFIIAAVTALAIFPAVYDTAQANVGRPTLVQLAVVFASGLGYESLISGILGLAGLEEKKRA